MSDIEILQAELQQSQYKVAVLQDFIRYFENKFREIADCAIIEGNYFESLYKMKQIARDCSNIIRDQRYDGTI